MEVIDAFDGDPAVFCIQDVAHLMPSLTHLAEIHVLDLRVALRENAAKATARTHGRHMFDHSNETSAWESAFPAHWDRRSLNSHWVHSPIYVSPQGPSGISLTMSITWHLELTNLALVPRINRRLPAKPLPSFPIETSNQSCRSSLAPSRSSGDIRSLKPCWIPTAE